MGAILGGTMRSPFTGIVFALELTHDVNMLLPLLVAVTIAHGFTVLMLPRSILTEKVARRGFHLSREYAVDPLEILFVREVMRTNTLAIAADTPIETLRQALHGGPERHPQRLYPVSGADGALVGVVTRRELQTIVDERRRVQRRRLRHEHHADADGRPSRRIAARGRLPDGRHRPDALSGGRARQERAAGRHDRADRSADRAHQESRSGGAA